MPDLTRNQRIALKLGYLPPGHPKGYTHTWCNPSDSNCALAAYQLPQFDTDPAASMELLHILTVHHPEYVKISFANGTFEVLVVGAGIGQGELLEAAIAAAYLEASGG